MTDKWLPESTWPLEWGKAVAKRTEQDGSNAEALMEAEAMQLEATGETDLGGARQAIAMRVLDVFPSPDA